MQINLILVYRVILSGAKLDLKWDFEQNVVVRFVERDTIFKTLLQLNENKLPSIFTFVDLLLQDAFSQTLDKCKTICR